MLSSLRDRFKTPAPLGAGLTMSANTSWSFDAGDYIASIAWLPDGQKLVVAPTEGSISVLHRATGSLALTLPGHASGNTALSSSSAAPLIATGGHDGRVRLWNTQSGVMEQELHAGQDWVEQVVFSPDGTLLAASAGKMLRIWTSTGELVSEYAEHDSTVAAVAWRPDSRGLATGCYNGVRLFRIGEKEPYEHFAWKGSIISLAWSANGRYVAGGSQESTIQFWRLPYRAGEELFMSGYSTKIRELSWNAESRYLASGGGEIVTVWDVSGKGPAGTRPIQLEGHADRITQLFFQHRGGLLASGGMDGRVFIWNLKSKQRQRYELAPSSPIAALVWSPDDAALAIGAANGAVCLWENTVG